MICYIISSQARTKTDVKWLEKARNSFFLAWIEHIFILRINEFQYWKKRCDLCRFPSVIKCCISIGMYKLPFFHKLNGFHYFIVSLAFGTRNFLWSFVFDCGTVILYTTKKLKVQLFLAKRHVMVRLQWKSTRVFMTYQRVFRIH